MHRCYSRRVMHLVRLGASFSGLCPPVSGVPLFVDHACARRSATMAARTASSGDRILPQVQNGIEPPFVTSLYRARPRIGSGGLGIALQVEDVDGAPPDSLALERLFDRHGFDH